jgi:hypothetical protein
MHKRHQSSFASRPDEASGVREQFRIPGAARFPGREALRGEHCQKQKTAEQAHYNVMTARVVGHGAGSGAAAEGLS